MRRSFPRTPGSPQASVTVETPAHNAPTPLLQIDSIFLGGDWECRAYYVICSEERCKYTKIFSISTLLFEEITKKNRIGHNFTIWCSTSLRRLKSAHGVSKFAL